MIRCRPIVQALIVCITGARFTKNLKIYLKVILSPVVSSWVKIILTIFVNRAPDVCDSEFYSLCGRP